jgi:hypothetical protein
MVASASAAPACRALASSILSCAAFLALAGCGAPADPKPPRPLVPEAVTDLAVQQVGSTVVLTFTLPKAAVDGRALEAPPEVEIYREFLAPTAQPAAKEASRYLAYRIPSALVDTYLAEGRVQFTDPFKPEEIAKYAGEQAAYVVRTRVSKRRASADSNLAATVLYAVAEPIREIQITVRQEAIDLSWQPPERLVTGQPAAVVGYRIYRGEVAPGAEAEAAQNPAKARLAGPMALAGVAASAAYSDAKFEFGHTYIYSVRSVAQYEAASIESADSALAVVTPRDTFPPAPPKDLVVIPVTGGPGEPAHLELSWAISPETDLAGYNVYRSEQEGVQGERLNRELLPTPTFRDMSVAVGRRYTYRVTAVDRAGNESLPSAAVSGAVPNEGTKP